MTSVIQRSLIAHNDGLSSITLNCSIKTKLLKMKVLSNLSI